MRVSSCITASVTQNTQVYRTRTFFFTNHLHNEAGYRTNKTKALVVNGRTGTTAVSCCGHFCALGCYGRDGTDTHHTGARAQGFKSSYDVIWEEENNQHFVTTKQYNVLVPDTTKPSWIKT